MEPESTYSVLSADYGTNPLVQSNYIAPSILAAYLIFSKVIGPNIMKDRKPYDLKLLILVYNTVLVASNVYAGYKMTRNAIDWWPYRCDFQNSPVYTEKQKHFFITWAVLLIKFAELFDTVFFIMRKKFNQVSFLHVFHHAVVCALTWISLKFKIIGYYNVLILAINCSIHILLYSYYTLSALGPEVKKYLWWKQYLTTMQIMQFFVLMSYMTISFLSGCEDLDYIGQTVLYVILAITVLFLNFYFKTYTTKKQN